MSFLTSHEYLQHALLAGLFTGTLCGMVGVFLVLAQATFLGIGIAHAAFAGALLGLMMGLPPMTTAIICGAGVAAVSGPLADRGALGPDTAIGVLFSVTIGTAFLIMGILPSGRTEALSLFWGAILTVSGRDVVILAIATALVLFLLTVFYRQIHVVVCHREVAAAAGIPAERYFYGMLCVTGMAVAVSLPAVGGLLVYALVINPAAAAFQLTHRFLAMIILSGIFGVVSCWSGLWASWMFDTPAGAMIVLASAAIFACCYMISPKRKRWHEHR